MAKSTAQTTTGAAAAAAAAADKTESEAGDGDDEWVTVDRSELHERVGPSLRRIHERSRSKSRRRPGGEVKQTTAHGAGAQSVPGAFPGGPPRDIVLEAGRAYLGLIAGGCRFWGHILQVSAEAFGAAMDLVAGRQPRSSPPPDTSAAGFEQLLRLMAELKAAKQDWAFDRVADVLSPERGEPVPWQRRHRVKP